jgi:class 3 adenylate cyclase/tetratricopeptide (TPR) repeat protein
MSSEAHHATVACLTCAAVHPAGTRFCSSCGSALAQVCPACGADAAADAAFCAACGAALRPDVGRVGAEDHEERRVVTVLFADLAGSTALGSRIDPEELRALQGELFELVHAEVLRFGGISEKFVGDAVLAVFGVPHTHDDDAERAVRAALAVRERFVGFARAVEERHGVEVGLRLGVNTGEVVAGRESAARGELMVTGDAVNVAARLQQRADPGQVLVGARTHTATRRAIRYASVGAARAKGKDAPVEAWEATAVVALPGRRGIEGLAAAMIGREEELAVLRALTARVRRERAPQLVTIYGHAGVGKTRLQTEFVSNLPDVQLLQGRCLPYGDGITYWPLGEAAKGHAGILDTDPGDVALAKLRSAITSIVSPDHVAGVVEAIAWTIGLTLPQDEDLDVRGMLRESWRRFLTGLGSNHLTVLVVEDVHWASEPLLELLEYLTDSLSDAAVLTICTARPEFFDTHAAWGGGLRDSTSIRLAPLPADESTQLVAALLGEGGLPQDLTRRIVARAEGNPFYVEEILQMLIDHDAIARENGSWAIRGRVDEVELPDSIHGVIAARVDLLDAASRDALRRCSVMGRVFWPSAVGVSEEVIAALGRRALVGEHVDTTIEGMREFSFKHALTQDVAYATLPLSERRVLHRQVGMWVEDVAPGRESEMAEVAAYHLDRALDYGETSPDVRARCCALLLVAGEAAIVRVATETAARMLSRAVELADDDRERFRALVGLGRANLMSADLDQGHAQFAAARDIAVTLGDRRLLAEALSWLSRASWVTGRWQDALPEATSAVETLAGLEETAQLARALARLSQLEMLRGLPTAEKRAQDAIAVARRVGDVHAELNARSNLLVTLVNRGLPLDLAEARDIVTRAVASGDALEAYRCLVNALWMGQAAMSREELDDALDDLRRLVDDLPPVEGLDVYFELSYAALVLVPSGDWVPLDLLIARERELLAMRLSGARMLSHELVGGMAFRRGDLRRAAGPLETLRLLALAAGEPQRILPMASVVMPYALQSGDRETVRELAESVLASTDREWAQLTTTAIPRVLAAAGETALLRRLETAFSERHSGVEAPRIALSLSVTSGLLSLVEGRAGDAVSRLDWAVEHERARGWHYRAACLELELAGALEAAERPDDAGSVRERAASVLEPLGCVNPY